AYNTDTPTEPDSSGPTRRLWYDAAFHRPGTGDFAFGSKNEWYIYIPDLEHPDKTQRVVLRGRDPYARRTIEATWEWRHKTWAIRITVFNQPEVEPKGVYYTFDALLREDNYKEIMTARLPRMLESAQVQPKFISNEIAYVFL